jgi:hypothetical protein
VANKKITKVKLESRKNMRKLAAALVDSLDADPGHDDVYLRTIDDGWYIIFQRTDYDRP